MAKTVSFSGETLSLADAALHHNDMSDALAQFFSPASQSYRVRFAGYRPAEVHEELTERLAELDRNTTMNLLATVEAAFRIDYLQRCYQKKKDDLSRRFWEIYKEKGTRASFEDEILGVWKDSTTENTRLISDLRGAFKFRHWLAHGRYWVPKFGRKYDYLSVYALALQTLSSFPLLSV